MKKNRRALKYAAAFMAVVMFNEAVFPLTAYALTSGPSSPEFSSFEPVSTNSMVNEFTGDFTYNIPLLNIPGDNGSGYPLSLSYHSGESPESEASWVGYGWTLNPGAINRGKRGFADDVKGSYTQYNKVPDNWTASVGVRGNTEIFGKDIGVGVNATARYNSYKGFGYTTGAGLSVAKGIVSLGFSFTDGQGSFSAQVNPAAIVDIIYSKKIKEIKDNYNSAMDKALNGKSIQEYAKLAAEADIAKKKATNSLNSKRGLAYIPTSFLASVPGLFGDSYKASSLSKYSGFSSNISIAAELTPLCAPVGFQAGLDGNFNIQFSENSTTHAYCGYMYSSDAYSDENMMMDYLVEKNYPYSKRDYYLGIPFAGNDEFSVMGEGISGSFRLRNKSAGYFRPNHVESYTGIANFGLEVQVGANMGTGGDIGTGYQRLVQSDEFFYALTPSAQDDVIRGYKFADNSNEGTYFRFENDLGGEVSHGYDLNFVKPHLKTAVVENVVQNSNSVIANISKKYNSQSSAADSYARSGRTAYIGYRTKAEAAFTLDNVHYRAYDKNNVAASTARPTLQDESICEFSTTGQDGNTFTYGIPVMNYGETNMNYGIHKCGGTVEQGAFAYIDNEDYNMEVGETNNDGYAGTYLLTQITTPDYLDLSYDGCTPDDFGGYTLFKYTRAYDNYKWRYPYKGMKYNPNHLCEKTDDIGTVSYGKKEVYYLDRIETKTHVAKFITEARWDGFDAVDNESTARQNSSGMGDHSLKKLTRIELYAKDENGNDGKLIQTVHFEYDYSTWPQTPNSKENTSENPGKGRLTLKKVWFEYNGVKNAKISPYLFEYNYPTATYPQPYGSSLNIQGLTQSANYAPTLLDRWGNYQVPDAAKLEYLFPCVDQTPPTSFDPAIYQLKKITLPSGGEIHVQYEQDDYLYVQDRRAMAMVSLKPGVNGDKQQKFYLNVEDDLGITDSNEKAALVALINQRYDRKKMFFKFLYTLTNQGHQEIIDGYVSFKNAYMEGGNVCIELDPSGTYSLPKDVARDFKRTERGHKLGNSNNLDVNVSGDSDEDGATEAVYALLNQVGKNQDDGYDKWDYDYSKSCFRIPVLHKKLGGGLRVKRLLMYDPGIETGAASVYGNEYYYKDEYGNSSGVASNEPAMGREENALIDIMDRRADQTFMNKVISGKDKEQYEGPIGESILPNPSVGYSRVLVKSISSTKSSTGITESTFYTCKDYPFDYDMTAYANANGLAPTGETCKFADHTEIMKGHSMKVILPMVLLNLNIDDQLLSQGYRFIMYNIHGQPKTISTYAVNTFEGVTSTTPTTSKQEFTYYKPGEKIPLFRGFGDITTGDPGREMEVLFEIRNIKDVTNEGNIEIDGSLGYCVIPIPFLTGWPTVSRTETSYGSLVATKIISYPVIQKSVTVSKDQIVQTTINEAFDPYTGNPLVTRIVDGYDGQNTTSGTHDGSYMSWNVPAAHVYNNMSQKATGERTVLFDTDGSLQYLSIDYNTSKITFPLATAYGQNFTEGDLIMVGNQTQQFMAHVTGIVSTTNTRELTIARTNNKTLPASFVPKFVEIVKSGKTNQLTAPAYEMTTYGNKELLSQTSESAFFNMAKVISANVTVYNDSNDFTLLDNSAFQKLLDNYPFTTGEGNCVTSCLPKDEDGAGQYFAAGYGKDGQPGTMTTGLNKYEYGMRGKYRPKRFYQYKDMISDANTSSASLIQKAGYFSILSGMFRYFSSNNDTKWLLTNTITKYNPDGNAVEERNLLDIYSAARFGYRGTMPVLVAKNASYGSVSFEGFESFVSSAFSVNGTSLILLDNYDVARGVLSSEYAHTGYTSIKLTNNTTDGVFMKVSLHKNKDMKASMWVKCDPAVLSPVKLCTPNGTVVPKLICRSGEWALYETTLSTGCITVSQNTTGTIYVDDIRLQPVDASMVCYVYDKNNKRLLASFGDQHFATLYQYNGEGKLVRKLIETEKGIKLLQETQYNTPAVNR